MAFKVFRIFFGLLLLLLVSGFLIPQKVVIPVQGATKSDYNANSFWYYPWGRSVTHKGVDIFAAKGTVVTSATPGLVVYAGTLARGGNVVVVLGPKWRFHYYAHLDSIHASVFSFANHTTQLGTVGTSGNARGKAPHLHYSIATPIPYLWRADAGIQGWKKMFYLNPVAYF